VKKFFDIAFNIWLIIRILGAIVRVLLWLGVFYTNSENVEGISVLLFGLLMIYLLYTASYTWVLYGSVKIFKWIDSKEHFFLFDFLRSGSCTYFPAESVEVAIERKHRNRILTKHRNRILTKITIAVLFLSFVLALVLSALGI
jgi:hypothetical protein